MKEKMLFAGVNIGRRFNTKEKELFLQQVIEMAEKQNLPHEFQTKHSRLFNICNLVIGNLKSAQKVVACAYDTPAETVYPGFKYFPFNPSFNKKEETKNLAVQCLGSFLCFLIVFLFLKDFKTLSIGLKALSILGTAVVGWRGYRFLMPSGNRVNFSRNSASVAAMLKLMETTQDTKTAYVFLDQNCSSYEGAKLLKEHCSDHQLVIILDNLASGEKTVVAHTPLVNPGKLVKEGWIDKEYDETANMLGLFQRSIMISCGSIQNKQFFVKNTGTKKDVEVNMERLVQITEALKEKLEEEK